MTSRVFRFGFVTGADALRATPVEAGSRSSLRSSDEPGSRLRFAPHSVLSGKRETNFSVTLKKIALPIDV